MVTLLWRGAGTERCIRMLDRSGRQCWAMPSGDIPPTPHLAFLLNSSEFLRRRSFGRIAFCVLRLTANALCWDPTHSFPSSIEQLHRALPHKERRATEFMLHQLGGHVARIGRISPLPSAAQHRSAQLAAEGRSCGPGRLIEMTASSRRRSRNRSHKCALGTACGEGEAPGGDRGKEAPTHQKNRKSQEQRECRES